MSFLKVFDSQADALHYVVLFAALLAAWPWFMSFFSGNLYLTSAASFVVFVAVDKMLHEVLNV